MIQTCGKSLFHIINDMLDFSKLDSGHLEIEALSFKPKLLLNDLMELYALQAQKKGIDFNVDVEESVPEWTVSDPNRIRQILSNLISNAIKFTYRGKITLSCSSTSLGQRKFLYFSVRDEGIGISEEVQKGLFKPFTQADKSTSRKYGGTGLGLSISKSLVDLMGGEIWVYSVPGSGSNFQFTIPFKSSEPTTIAQDPLDTELNHYSSAFPMNILIVDDNPINRTVVQKHLEWMGYHPDESEDGFQSLRMLERKKYDLVLMDCHMPKMDGYETTRNIIERYEKGRPRICALTASTMDEDRKRCLENGMDSFLSKPIERLALAEELKKCFQAKREIDEIREC